MRCFYRNLLVLSMAIGPFINSLSAYDESGFFLMPDNPLLLYYTPEAVKSDTLPAYWSSTWNIALYATTTRSSDPLNLLPPSFEAQWTDAHYQRNLRRNDVLQTWENDFRVTPFLEGNPLEDMERCGRKLQTLHSRYGIQIVPCNIDVLQLNFSTFPFPEGHKNTFFAVKLYGAEWVRPWDDIPGLCRRSLPGGWVLRQKTSSVALNHIRLTSPESHVFAIAIQGPGINSGDITQYGSLICLYYVPKPGQALSRIDQSRSLLKEILPGKLKAMQDFILSEDWHWNLLVSSLKPPVQATSSAKSGKATRVPDAPPARPKPWSPLREVPSKGKVKGITCFSDTPVRQSWLYQHQQDISDRPFLEAVYVHSYGSVTFNPYGSLSLVNLIWDERVKGEALREKCSEYFNVDALPQELRDFLFGPNAPFAKLRFQIHIQRYMDGSKQVEETTSDGKKQKITVPDLVQCLRPHYAVANMPFPDNK
ncbi:MAG: hypothetical protein LBD40_01950, partial [Puniceicoccales bacterium]|nr:hypothetical protein [Puniceicoccales bacterium]